MTRSKTKDTMISMFYEEIVKLNTSLGTIASAVQRMEERSRIKHDSEVAELEQRENFYKRQAEMLEKTNTLFKNPKLEEYLGSLSTMVRDLGPEGMRKMTDASFMYTQEMMKSQKEFDKILGRGYNQGEATFIPKEGVEIPGSDMSLKDLNNVLDQNGGWRIIMTEQEQDKSKEEENKEKQEEPKGNEDKKE